MLRRLANLFGDIRTAHVFVAVPFSVFVAFTADGDVIRPEFTGAYLAVLAAAWILARRFPPSLIVAASFWLVAASGPIWAWITVRDHLAWLPGLAAVALYLWIAGTEFLYSSQDTPHGEASGLRVISGRADSHIATVTAITLHVFFIIALVLLGVLGGLGRGFAFTVGFAIVVTAAQHRVVHRHGVCRSWPIAFLTNAFCSALLCLSAL